MPLKIDTERCELIIFRDFDPTTEMRPQLVIIMNAVLSNTGLFPDALTRVYSLARCGKPN